MARKLTWDLVIAGLVFWVLTTLINTGGLSLVGLKAAGFQTLIFLMFYAVIKVGWIIFKGDQKQ